MIKTRISIFLSNEERDALRKLADQEIRDARSQAALIIRHELQRCGLLPIDSINQVSGKVGDERKSNLS